MCTSSIGLDGFAYNFSWVLNGDTFEFTYLQTEGNANLANVALGSCIDSVAPSCLVSWVCMYLFVYL